MIDSPREFRGLEIAVRGSEVKRLNPYTYRVRSQSNPEKWYLVVRDDYNEWSCECPDHIHRQVICKHIHAVNFSLKLRQKASEESSNIGGVELDHEELCPKCGSMEVVKAGKRKRNGDEVQRYLCKTCDYRFISETVFTKVKNTPQAITASLDLYYKGCSLRDIQDHLRQFYHIKVSHVAILKWIRRYVELMKSYVDKLTPKTSGIWHTDEMMVKIKDNGVKDDKGEWRWLWNLMDHDTRFLIACQLHKHKEVSDAREVFAEAKERAKGKPIAVVHDGLQTYSEAFKKEFFTLRTPRVQEVRSVGQRDGFNQNVERLQGTIREREKVMRAMENDESAKMLMEGHKIFYNFIRPHIGLNGKTPAEMACINLNLGGNRWKDLIRQASISRKLTAKPKNSSSP